MEHFNFIGNTNICNLLPISTDVTYDHLLGRNPYKCISSCPSFIIGIGIGSC